MQVKAEEERRARLEQVQRNELINDICSTISQNKTDLEVEISKISSFLNLVEEFVIKYDEEEQNMAIWQSKVIVKNLNKVVVFKIIEKQLEKISDDAMFEFLGGTNFFNIIEEISAKECKIERLMCVWKAQSVIKNIKYQFERIWNCDSKDYQIAVLKGMIALC